jgi:hypothetical protein
MEQLIIDGFRNYNKRVMQRAWRDYKIKKNTKCYEEWTFSESLYWAHKTIKALCKNGYYNKSNVNKK